MGASDRLTQKKTVWRKASPDKLQVHGASRGFEFWGCVFHLWPDHIGKQGVHFCHIDPFLRVLRLKLQQNRSPRPCSPVLVSDNFENLPLLQAYLCPGAKSVSLLGPECPSLHILWLADSWQTYADFGTL